MFANRVQFNCTAPGTGAFEIGSAVTGYRTPAQVTGFLVNGRLMGYLAYASATEWEIGIGTLTDSAPDTLARTVILASTNAGAAVNFAGALVVASANVAELTGAHRGEFNIATSGGTATALTAAFWPPIFALRDGLEVTVRLHAAIGAAATFAPNGLTAKPLRQQSPAGLVATAAADWPIKTFLNLRYDATEEVWQILNGMVQEAVPDASDTVKGIVEKATMAEALAGSDTDRFVTPAHLGAYTKQGGSNLADGATVTIPATGGTYFVLDGTTSLTTVAIEGGNAARVNGTRVLFRFAAAKSVVHSSSLNLVGDTNLAAVAGDILELVYEGSGVWREADFHAADLPDPPAPAGWEDLGVTVLTAASEFVMSGMDADIRHVRVFFSLVPSANAALRLQTYGADNVLDTGGSDYAGELWTRDTVVIDAVSTDYVKPTSGNAAHITVTPEVDSSDSAGEGADGRFYIFNLPASLASNIEGGGGCSIPGGDFRKFSFAGKRRAKEAVKGFRLFSSTGTLTGQVRVEVMRDP